MQDVLLVLELEEIMSHVNVPPRLPVVLVVLWIPGHRWAYGMSVWEVAAIPRPRFPHTDTCFTRSKDSKIASNLV